MILQTDKINRIAVLNKCDYVMKLEKCFRKMKCVTIYEDLTSSINNKVKYFKDGNWPPDIKSLIKYNYSSAAPRISGRLKDLKKDLRPIVAKYSSSTYFLEKTFVPVLQGFITGFTSFIKVN